MGSKSIVLPTQNYFRGTLRKYLLTPLSDAYAHRRFITYNAL